ncbi:MAG: methionine synthase [Elusimicrobiota bacterium]
MKTKNVITTGIGSLPHTDPVRAAEIVVNGFDIPFLLQLPKRNFRESMYIQYSEGLPGVILNQEKQVVYVDMSKENLPEEYERFYQAVIDNDIDKFCISQDYAAGIYSVIDVLKLYSNKKFHKIKVQVTGPVSFGLTVTDETGKSILHNEQYSDVLVKGLLMKALWQVGFVRKNMPDSRILAFIDEPYLSAFGSAYVPVSREVVVKCINEIADALHKIDVEVGIHCCGNTDWSILMDTSIDVLSFDAYNYFETLLLYKSKLAEFITSGRKLAWGIVPSNNDVIADAVVELKQRINHGIEVLASKGIDKDIIMENIIITPSCGLGSLEPVRSENIVNLINELKIELQK